MKNKKYKTKNIVLNPEVNCQYRTLKDILNTLTQMGIKPGHYDQLSFDLDYSNCYYENDTPSVYLNGRGIIIEKD